MMGLTPGPLVLLIFLFALKILLVLLVTPLVVFEAWFLAFLFQWELSQLVMLFCWLRSYQYDSSPKVVDSLKYFCAQSSHFPSKFENLFHS